MTHDDAQQLLGAYALDSTNEEEREQVEAHLVGCAICQAEVATHRELAAMMAVAPGSEPPAGLWDKIAASTFSAPSRAGEHTPASYPVLVPATAAAGGQRLRLLRARARTLGLAAGAAAVAAAVAFASVFGVQVGHLRSQVHRLEQQVGASSVASAAARAAAGPHATVTLAAAGGGPAATVLVAPHGLAYWLSSSLARLPGSKTYQLWGLVDGKPVSLALLGADPREVGLFRVGPGTTKLMVTAEPAGGAPLPTTAVLATGALPGGAIT